MRHFPNLVSKIKLNNEKQARSDSHLKYLSQCQENSLIPRGFNLVKLVKSEIIWDSSKDTFEILMEASNKLLEKEIVSMKVIVAPFSSPLSATLL